MKTEGRERAVCPLNVLRYKCNSDSKAGDATSWTSWTAAHTHT